MKSINSLPGIKDIALMAGVSIGTVDRALHNRGRIAEETRKKIIAIAEKIKYRPNINARSLVRHRALTVALLIPGQHDDYWKQAWNGFVSNITEREQLGVFTEPFFYTEDSIESFNAAVLLAKKRKPDGIVIATAFIEQAKPVCDYFRDLSIPVVLMGTEIPETSPLCLISSDNSPAGRVAAELLRKTARKKGQFLLIHSSAKPGNSLQQDEMEKGFTEYLAKECPKRKYRVITPAKTKQQYESQLRELFHARKISGVFVSGQDVSRIAAFLESENIKKLKLVGCDLSADNIKQLRTGRIDFLINRKPEKQARLAIETLCDFLLNGGEVPPVKLLPAEIICSTNIDSIINAAD